MTEKRYDRQLREILKILQNDYAGILLPGMHVDSRYYVQAAGMAWKEGKLDALLMFRYVSQLLATTGDRSLRLTLTAEDYKPTRPGFDVRRYEDSLYVTRVDGDERLTPGDRIIALNGIAPNVHRQSFQRNFLYGTIPERELWGNVLKMTDRITVCHKDGSKEELAVRKLTSPRSQVDHQLTHTGSALLLRVGDVGDGELLEAFIREHSSEMDTAETLIIDLRDTHDGDEDAFLPLIPYILNGPKTMSEANGPQELVNLYTANNSIRRYRLLEPYAGDPEADRLMGDLEKHAGKGPVEETTDLWVDMPEVIQERGHRTILLTDTFTEGSAEAFAMLARKEGRARIVGRPTMGNLDCSQTLTVRISDEFCLTYPCAVTRQAKEGNGVMWRGVPCDQYVPFLPEECMIDRILEAAQNGDSVYAD